jgi:mannose-1-phosphate guanylyltransferase
MDTSSLHVVVLAGGKGTRFWPLSTPQRPKQFLRLFDDRSLLRAAVERVLPLVGPERVWISTDESLADLSQAELEQIPQDHFVLEPVARNTLPGVALACSRVQSVAPEAVVAMVCADHLIRRDADFRALLAAAADIAATEDVFLTFGIYPTRPETGFGYIRVGEALGDRHSPRPYRVLGFTEKPNRALAQAFLADGHYLWNSGMFVWRLTTFFDALRKHRAALAEQIARIAERPDRLAEVYPRVESVSIDYGLMEKVENIVVLPADIGWDDVGSWESVWDVWDRDEDENAVVGEHIGLDTRNCLIFGGSKPIATVGVDGLIIVETDDALLICPRERAQDVRDLADRVLARSHRHRHRL